MRPVDVNCDARRKSSLSQSWSPAVRTLRRTADPGNELERGSRHSGVAPGSKSSSPAGRSVQRPPAALVPWNPRMRPTGCFVLRLTLWLRGILSRRGGSCGSACGLAPLASTPAHRTQDSTHVLTFLGDGWVVSRTRSRSDVSPPIVGCDGAARRRHGTRAGRVTSLDSSEE